MMQPSDLTGRYSVAPIGSCRIAAPLRVAQERHGIRLNRSRSYGYAHSIPEAVQMARFFQGDFSPPRTLWPLLSRDQGFDRCAKAHHVVADRYVVEISSAKEIRVDGTYVQLNYLQSTYRDFFSDRDRAQQFWEAASSDDQTTIDETLAQLWPGRQLALERVAGRGGQRLVAFAPDDEAGDRDVGVVVG